MFMWPCHHADMPDPEITSSFFTPHGEAAAFICGKPAVSRRVLDKLLPELRGRAFTVTGLEGANVVQRIRHEIAEHARGR